MTSGRSFPSVTVQDMVQDMAGHPRRERKKDLEVTARCVSGQAQGPEGDDGRAV